MEKSPQNVSKSEVLDFEWPIEWLKQRWKTFVKLSGPRAVILPAISPKEKIRPLQHALTNLISLHDLTTSRVAKTKGEEDLFIFHSHADLFHLMFM